MSDFSLKRGESRTVTFALKAPGTNNPFDATGYTVSLVVDGHGMHTTITGTLDSPATLGTGSFVVDASALKPTVSRAGKRLAPYDFEVWAVAGSTRIPMLTGTFDVVDVPQVA